MHPLRFIPLLAIGPILGLSWLVLALFDLDGSTGRSEYIGLGYLFGTLFGQTTLAGAWTALGPLPWYVRLVLAPIWLAILWVCLALNMGIHGGPDELVLLFAGCLFGQWIVVQLPLWGLALGYGLHVQQRRDSWGSNRRASRPDNFSSASDNCWS
jgi:hypothetical protein